MKLSGRDDACVGNPHHCQSLEAAGALPDHLLLRRLSGPGERQLRRAHDEPAARSFTNRIRLRRRNLLYRLFHLRGAIQPAAGAFRRAQVDRPDHAELGNSVGRDGAYPEHRQRHRTGQRTHLLSAAGSAGRGRGRFLSRHHLLFDAVVSHGVSGTDRRLLHGRHSVVHRDWRADLGRTAVFARRAWPRRMAMAVRH